MDRIILIYALKVYGKILYKIWLIINLKNFVSEYTKWNKHITLISLCSTDFSHICWSYAPIYENKLKKKHYIKWPLWVPILWIQLCLHYKQLSIHSAQVSYSSVSDFCDQYCTTVILQVWFLDQQFQHYLGTC